jgi:hypothetical protein
MATASRGVKLLPMMHHLHQAMSSRTPRNFVSVNPPPTMPLNFAHEIPHYLTRLADILDKSPLFDGSGCVFKNCKVMSLPKSDARIWEIFHENSRKIHNSLSWFLSTFGNGMRLFDSNRNPIRDGVVLSVDIEDKKRSLETLKSSYTQVLNRMIDGWRVEEPKKNPPTYFEGELEEFDVFTKDKSLISNL